MKNKFLNISLSYFHRKIGPMIFYSYPEDMLDDKLSSRIANIMDQQFNEGFFTHTFEDIITMNYYFEVQSDWARGNNDMLMISIIFNEQTDTKIEEEIQNLCIEFSEKLKSNEEIYTAFYISDISHFNNEEQESIIKNNERVKLWVRELYWAAIDATREKTEEERLANLLNKKYIFLTLRKLSKGPLPLEWLSEWFFENFPDKDFTSIIETLVERQLIFINQIGIVEKYVLLLKEVNAERIPPDSVIEYIDETPELIDLILPKVQKYFSKYETKTDEELEEDSFLLFQIIADPKKYNVLSELRNGLIPRDKLPKLISKRNLDALSRVLEFLKKYDIIEELKFKNERYVVLKTNLQITTAFPEYLRKLLPEESKPVIADKSTAVEEEKEKQEEIAEILYDLRKKGLKKSKEEKIYNFLENTSSKSNNDSQEEKNNSFNETNVDDFNKEID
ncbi:MAG: hypothetical protein GF317_01845 [Candidatus Lokiarchaeota archaeon]|nr:hypothetical protein [Candidatus Lokiarchaeota archaeon]MBD3198683.1 hypothetical protein [Candidatus Lokiarchaeota archaeon]